MLRLGADACPYLISASGQMGYNNIIMGPTDRVLREGDVLIIDTGVNFDGYFSDFDRNFGFSKTDQATHNAYEALYAFPVTGSTWVPPSTNASGSTIPAGMARK